MTVLERMSPLRFAPIWVRHQHFARYEWAATLCAGKVVVDAACGTGYGSAILRRAGASEVFGFDISLEAVAEGSAHYPDAGLQFAQADVAALPLASASADVFVSFETIEHLTDEHGLLKEAVRVLRPNGVFLCSSPNRTVTNPGTAITDQPFNPHHCREYSPAEFDALLRPYFREVAWLGQTNFSNRWLQTLDATARVHRGLAVKVHQLRKLAGWRRENRSRHLPRPFQADQHPEFLIAMCRA
jgi:SAM-dependent methyltransferase